MSKITVAVSGACGRMGKEVCRAVLEDEQLELVAALDVTEKDRDIGLILDNKELGLPVEVLSKDSLQRKSPQVMVDFSTPLSVFSNTELAISCGIRPVVGTTGLSAADLENLGVLLNKAGLGGIVAPNFALGAVLMMKFSALAAHYLPQAEIIELHHDNKMDAPSGTALKTAEMIAGGRESGRDTLPAEKEEIVKLTGVRGGVREGIHIHSVRLNGLIAHQEVIFGGTGQTLTIRHDSFDRRSFMPGVVLAVKEVVQTTGLIYGLENIL